MYTTYTLVAFQTFHPVKLLIPNANGVLGELDSAYRWYNIYSIQVLLSQMLDGESSTRSITPNADEGEEYHPKFTAGSTSSIPSFDLKLTLQSCWDREQLLTGFNY